MKSSDVMFLLPNELGEFVFGKIIDFERKGNIVRFYLGDVNNSNGYYGDDWDDVPYEHNAGKVYEQYV